MNDVKDFWANAHKNNHVGPLTGTKPAKVLGYFGLQDKIKKNMNLLNIGVGFGHCTRKFSTMCNTYALDVCEEALNRVKGCTVERFLHENLDTLPDNHFDLAVSLLVSGHMKEDDLLSQIKNVLRSLKPDGRFYLQFGGNKASSIAPNNLKEQTVDFQKGKNVPAEIQRNGRTIEYAKGLVQKCGGVIRFVSGKKDFPNCYWYFFIIQRV